MMRVLILLLFLLLPSLAQATQYYIRVGGLDAHTGTSNTDGGAWLTLQKACTTMVAGDTTTIVDGTYTSGEIQCNTNGTANSPITIQAATKWGAVVSSTSGCHPNLSIYGSYVVIDGLSFVIDNTNVYCTPNSASGTAIRAWMDNGGNHVTIKNIKTDNPVDSQGRTIRSHGIKTNQANSTIYNNELAAGLEVIGNNSVAYGNHITGGGAWKNGIVVKGGSQNVQVYNNVIDANPAIDAVGISLGGQTGGISAPECDHCVAYNNVIIISPAAYGGAMSFQGSNGSAFINNYAKNNGIAMAQGGSIFLNTNNTWKNNIIDCGGSVATKSMSGTTTIDYNDFFNCSAPPTQTHPIVGNPQFVSATDYHLLAGSPAIGTGQVVGFTSLTGALIPVSLDYVGATRTPPWSLGIYALAGAVKDIVPPQPPSGLTVSP